MIHNPFRPILFLLITGVAVLSGCKGTSPPTVHQLPPTSVATSISFEDKLLGEGIGGKISVIRSANDNDATSYVLRWGSNGVPVATNPQFSNFIARFEITGGYTETPYEYELYFPQQPPVDLGIDSIIVYTANSIGENPIGLATLFENIIDDPQGGIVFPENVTFTDSENRIHIAGTVTFSPAADETGISDYVIRYVGQTGCTLYGEPLDIIPVGEPPVFNLTARTPPTSARAIAVIPRDAEQREPDRCAAFPVSDTATFNHIVESTTPTYLATRVTLSADLDDTHNFTALLRVQGSGDERDLSTGYYVNLLDDVTGLCSTRIAYFPKTGNREWHEFSFDQWTFPPNTTRLLVSTGTECGFTSGEPHVINLNNQRGNWHLIISKASGNCLRKEESEPASPDDDGLSSILGLATCDAYDPAQRFTVTNLWQADGNNNYVIYRVTSATTDSCLWRRENDATQNWQVKKVCDGTEGTTAQVRILANNNANGRRDKTMAIRRAAGENWEYSCARESQTHPLVSAWGDCSSAGLFNFAPAGTDDESRYAVFYDAP